MGSHVGGAIAGDVLVDYGCGAPLCNERLLLEYGFVLRPHPHDRLVLPLGAIAVGLAAVAAAEEEDAGGEGDEDGGEAEAAALGAAQQRLLAQLGDVEAAGLSFGADGAPRDETLALALVLTARRAAELTPATPAELVAAARRADGGASAAAQRARCALRTVATEALEQVVVAMGAADGGGRSGGFEEAARLYCESRREILERACEQLADR